MHCSLRRGRPLLLVLSVVAGLALVPAGPAGAAGTTVRVSVASGGAQGMGYSALPVLTSDGASVLFSSDGELVPGALGAQLYLHHADTGVTELVTVSTTGGASQGDLASDHDMSGDGRVVVFDSLASDLALPDDDTCLEGEVNDEGEVEWENVGCIDVFLRDMVSDTTVKLSLGQGGDQADGRSVHPRVSDDGGRVVFLSEASNLVAGDTPGTWDVFVRDVAAGTTTRLTDGDGAPGSPSISADGTTVAYRKGADIVVHDLGTGTAAALPLGVSGATNQDGPALSGDGSLVAFYTNAKLVGADLNNGYDAYLYDRNTSPALTLLSATDAGTQTVYADRPELSDDGRFALFRGNGGLVPGTAADRGYVYVRELATGVLRVANVDTSGNPSAGGSDTGWRSLSADGSRVAFMSRAADLVEGDTNGTDDIFVHSFETPVAPGNLDAVLDGSGGVLSTGTTATSVVPVVAAITPPVGVEGTLTVALQPSDPLAPAGFAFFDSQLVIEAPPATAETPYVVTFTVDAGQLGSVAPGDVQVFRNGVAVADCTDPTSAVPDPCVAGRAEGPDGDAVVTVRTSHFSVWTLGRLAYELVGPLAPVAPLPTVNVVKSGSAVPVTFGLGGDRGPDVFADGYPRTTTAGGCGGSGLIQETISPGGAGLAYDGMTGTYTYVWKTSRGASGCRELVVRFRDGTELTMRFRLT